MRNRKLPPPEEWDFRSVHPSAFEAAALWEYARTSDKVRPVVENWQKQLAADRRALPAWPNVMAFQVFELVEERMDFPAPWIAKNIRYERNPLFSRILCAPLPLSHNRTASCGYRLSIAWDGSTTAEIIADMSRWIREEAKKHRREMRRGKQSQVQSEPLKWLAAYRLRRAGFTYADAFDPLYSLIAIDEKTTILPYYAEPSEWTDAIHKAEKILAKLELGF